MNNITEGNLPPAEEFKLRNTTPSDFVGWVEHYMSEAVFRSSAELPETLLPDGSVRVRYIYTESSFGSSTEPLPDGGYLVTLYRLEWPSTDASSGEKLHPQSPLVVVTVGPTDSEGIIKVRVECLDDEGIGHFGGLLAQVKPQWKSRLIEESPQRLTAPNGAVDEGAGSAVVVDHLSDLNGEAYLRHSRIYRAIESQVKARRVPGTYKLEKGSIEYLAKVLLTKNDDKLVCCTKTLSKIIKKGLHGDFDHDIEVRH